MSFITKLAAYTLRQMLGNSAAIYVEKIGQFFVDPTRALPNALNLANQQTWQLMELALAGDKLSERLKRWLISGQMRGILQPLREQVQQLGSNFRSECLGELQAARSAGVLAVGTGQELIALGQDVRVMVEPAALLAGAQQVVTQAVDGLLPYPQLAKLLGNQDGGGALLITAFEYFLRQEIGKLPRLREELQINLLQQLAQDQLAGWEELHRLLTEQSGEIGAELAGLAENMSEVLAMLRQIQAKLPNSAQRGPVSPRHSSILRSAADAKLLAELERRLNALPPDGRTPELLNYIGRLAMAVGVFNIAGERFSQAATAASAAGESTMQAEAHYNTYRALLEQHLWDEALVAMLAAAQLDPGRFALFPLDDYIPQRILGAGGFGVAFLCQHAHLGEQQVVKTLHTEELQLDAGRDIATIFREGSILTRLQHPSIIAVKHAGYAAANRQRPYLAMEYFPGVSLGDYLNQHGCLNLEQTVALAKPVAEALLVAHEQGIWHRDLKPDNLLVRVDKAGGWAVKLIDFGLAVRGKVVRASVMAGVTHQSIMGQSLGGTYLFSAPEQLGITADKVGPWSDVYAFGKTLAHALIKNTEPTVDDWEEYGLANHALVKLINSCIRRVPAKRLQDFAAVLKVLNAEDATKRNQEEERQAAEVTRKHQEAEAARRVQEEQQRLAAEVTRKYQEAEAARKQQEEQQRLTAEVTRKQQEAEAARKQQEEQQRLAAEAKRKQQEAETAQRNLEEQQRQAAEAKRKQQEIEVARRAQEEQQRQSAEVIRKQQEIEVARKAEEEQQHQADEAKRKQQEAESARKVQKKQQQAAKIKRKQQEAKAARKAQEEQQRLAAGQFQRAADSAAYKGATLKQTEACIYLENNSSFIKSLKDVTRILDTKSLPNVLIKVAGDKMQLTATDLELEIRTVSPIISGDDELILSLQAKKFEDLCKALPDGEIGIFVNDDKATIRSGKGSYRLNTLPATDYPTLGMPLVEMSFSIVSSVLRKLLEHTDFSIAHNDARYYLNGLLFDLSKNHSSLDIGTEPTRDGRQRLRCVGVDGHRMSICDAVLDADLEDRQLIVPRKAILELIKLLDDSDSKVLIDISTGFCRFTMGEVVLTIKLIDGKFPEYQKVIPRNLEKTALVNRKTMRRALLRASILSYDRYHCIKLSFEPGVDGASGVLHLETSNADLGNAKEEMDVDYQGEETSISFNVNYVLDILNVIDCKSVAIDFVDRISSAVYRDPDDLTRLYVVMPMKL